MRYAQIVMGPAGCGKSTYCSTIVEHCENIGRKVHVVNLDPAAEHFSYEALADIRGLIHVDDAMDEEELNFGPNGALVFCLEYLVENIDTWIEEELENTDEDYILFDCPGQIELYTHLDIMQQFTGCLQKRNFHVCGVYLLDSQFMLDGTKFLAGVMTALSALMKLEIPHVSVLTKMDLLNKHARKQIDRFLEPNVQSFVEDIKDTTEWEKKYRKLNEALASLIDDYSLIKFLPLNIQKPESIEELLITIDNAIQYGEDAEVKAKDIDVEDDESPNIFSF